MKKLIAGGGIIVGLVVGAIVGLVAGILTWAVMTACAAAYKED